MVHVVTRFNTASNASLHGTITPLDGDNGSVPIAPILHSKPTSPQPISFLRATTKKQTEKGPNSPLNSTRVRARAARQCCAGYTLADLCSPDPVLPPLLLPPPPLSNNPSLLLMLYPHKGSVSLQLERPRMPSIYNSLHSTICTIGNCFVNQNGPPCAS